MAEAQNNNEQEQDDVADKAAKIGEELGVEKDANGKEKIPDYEVIEDDERIAKTRDDGRTTADASERKKLSTKERRALRKKKLIEKVSAEKDAEITALRREVEESKSWRYQVEDRLAGADKAKIADAIHQTQAMLTQAENDHTIAFTEGDPAKATKAMKMMYDAVRRLEQLQGIKQQFDKNATQQPQQQGNQVDPVLVSKAKAWAAKNKDWYNANSGDEDSEIAKAVSQALANEGFDPKSDDFWDELDERLAKRGIGYDDEAHELDEEEDERPAAKPKRRSAPIGGGSSRGDVGSKREIRLPPEFIKTLKDNGIWADTDKRNRIINNYVKNQKAKG